MKFAVSHRRSGKTCNVIAETEGQAALRGAIKLGIRDFGYRPTTANNEGGSIYSIYGPTRNGAQSLCGNVVVE